jgi:hypothetical protein
LDYIIRNTGAAALLFFYIGFPIFVVTKILKTKIGGISVEEASLEELSAMVERAPRRRLNRPRRIQILKNIIKFRDVLCLGRDDAEDNRLQHASGQTVAEALSMQELQIVFTFRNGKVNRLMTKFLLRNDP